MSDWVYSVEEIEEVQDTIIQLNTQLDEVATFLSSVTFLLSKQYEEVAKEGNDEKAAAIQEAAQEVQALTARIDNGAALGELQKHLDSLAEDDD